MLYLQIINVKSILFVTLKVLDHSLKLKLMLKITAALFTKVIGLNESVTNVV